MPVKLELYKDKIKTQISGDKFYALLDVIKAQLVRTYDPEIKSWIIPLSGFNVLRSDLEKIDTIQVDSQLESAVNGVSRTLSTIKSVEYSSDPIDIPGLHVNPFQFQNTAIRFLHDSCRGLDADGVGLGKTLNAIATTLMLYNEKKIKSVLIVAPRSVRDEWIDMVERFTDFKLHLIEEDRKYTQDNLFNFITYDMLIKDVFLVEKIPNTNFKRHRYNKHTIRDLGKYDVLVCDEVHRCGNNKTYRSKAIRKISKDIPYMFGLSATPLQNHLRELYYIFQIIDNNILGNYMTFAAEHFVKGGFQNREIVGYRNLDIVAAKIAPYMIRRTREDVSEHLPKRTEVRKWVSLTREQRRQYDAIKDKILQIESDPSKEVRVKEAEALAETQYIRQACLSTHLIDPEADIHSSKLELLEEMVEDIYNDGNKMIIYCFYTKMAEVIRDRCAKYGVVYLSGENSDDIDGVKKEFAKPENKVLVMTKVGGEGLNLEMANFFIFFNPEFNPQIMTQLSGRIDRLTQKKPIEIIHLLARDTYEERMTKIIDEKKALFDNVINWRKLIRESI